MTIQHEIYAIFQRYDPYNFEPISCLHDCSDLLEKACRVGEELYPDTIEKAQAACNAYGYASYLFLENGFSSAATAILITAWNNFSAIQNECKTRVYRAGISMYLAKTYLKLRDKGTSLRWALLTQADDLLGEHAEGGGAGKQMLQTVLGMSEVALGELSHVALTNLQKIHAENNDWSVPHAFAEDVITRFTYNYPENADIFATTFDVLEYPLNTTYFGTLLKKVNGDALTPKEKGDQLEDLATYLFLLIPGLIPRRNLIDETLAFESDIVIRNLTMSTNVITELFGRHFLAECKNWENPVGVRDIGYFLYRMRLTHARFGVVFAKSGITGDEEQAKAANSLIRKAFHEDGNICIVIDNDSLTQLYRGEKTFWPLLLDRIERIRFGRSR